MAETKKRQRDKARQQRQQKQMQKQIDSNIKLVNYQPKGFLNASQFAEKAGVSIPTISKARKEGRFSQNNMRWVKLEGKQKVLQIHWDTEGPAYIKSRPVETWPQWFKDQEEIHEKDIQTAQTETRNGGAGAGQHTAMGQVVVVDLNTAKVREKQLAIYAKELEIMRAKNEVLELHEVADLLLEVATEVRQAIMAIGPRVAPLLAAEETSHGCLHILEDEHTKTLAVLSKLDTYLEGKQNGHG